MFTAAVFLVSAATAMIILIIMTIPVYIAPFAEHQRNWEEMLAA